MPRTSSRKPGCAGIRPVPAARSPTCAPGSPPGGARPGGGGFGRERLRSAAHRRETYTGNWLPEPVVTGYLGSHEADPLSAVVAQEDARFAAMVVLERLSPDQ